ncbi:MAG: M13 family metallopeptidase [Byssovorax sp.]
MIRRLVLLSAVSLITPRVFATDSAWRFPVENLDPTVAPAQDFYEYAVGGWRRNHPLPAAYERLGTFDVLQQKTEGQIHVILEEASRASAPEGSDLQKIGDFYESGMDVAAIEAAGTGPINPEIARIEAVQDLDDLQTEIVRLHATGIDVVFDFGAMPDPLESTLTIGVADEGGLGLPDRSYYLADDEGSRTLRQQYAEHIGRMLELSGEPAAEARADADRVVRLEVALAEGSMSRVERRDPHAVYNEMVLAALAELTPHFSWTRYFQQIGRPEITRINVTSPRFFRTVDNLFATSSIEDWRAYLRWHLVDSTAPYLPEAFVNERFRFRSKLTGVTEQQPRWLRVLRAENGALGFAVGKLYVERHFPPDSKARVDAILRNVQAALATSLSTLHWMSPETRGRALEKLQRMTNKIGYPERWRDYTGLTIDRGPFVLNVLRASAFEVRQKLDKIGKPVDRGEWEMTPQTVNAYYDPSLNVIVFPAGILQPPFFGADAPATWNYGAVGAVIGHEITHGFDDQGAQYDGRGNLVNWWTEADYTLFLAHTSCVARQFSEFTVAGGERVNGLLVTGEATADLGGVQLALRALAASAEGQAEAGRRFDGFTADQLFFLGFANVWASNIRPEAERSRAVLDPHPPPRYRVNGTLSNVPEFQAAFAIPAGSPMVREDRCGLWE